ncbi:MaoC/PaaZ C-terminal domain-containing protein [Pseudoxanthomonas japonensis]|uniref:MaoC/PaaZ C-terminal domain-containing protein n=1 Tax=Pseudoxanthomonas japonensis TaxID=69284 RepID=UPI001BD0CB8D|nr:MaoC/PaaZ C-terminal domain-containing protein [Pseudoxanthomonas japonensis]MCR6626423.1 MaoC/PaaZ C-terminal domain-containing protein [Pseudoxanthomonas sp.]
MATESMHGGGARTTTTREWLDTSGGERDLVRAILSDRLDDVLIVSSSAARIERCLRLGFPVTSVEPRLRLRKSTSTEESDGHPAPAVHSDAPEILFALGQADIDLNALLRSGYVVTETLWTMRLEPALSRSVLPVLEREFSLTDEDVLAYGEQSGDLNPLHFDDDFARGLGFEQRITHGMLFNGWLTRLLGTEHPGAGTIFLRNATSYFAPVYAGRTYKVRISTPYQHIDKGTYLVVAQLLDPTGQHCTVSYNDVMLRPPKV